MNYTAAIKSLWELFPYNRRMIKLIVGCTAKHVRCVEEELTGKGIEADASALTEIMLTRKKAIDALLTFKSASTTEDGKSLYNYIGVLSYIGVPYAVVEELFYNVKPSLISMAYNYGKHKAPQLNSATFGMPQEIYGSLFTTRAEPEVTIVNTERDAIKEYKKEKMKRLKEKRK